MGRSCAPAHRVPHVYDDPPPQQPSATTGSSPTTPGRGSARKRSAGTTDAVSAPACQSSWTPFAKGGTTSGSAVSAPGRRPLTSHTPATSAGNATRCFQPRRWAPTGARSAPRWPSASGPNHPRTEGEGLHRRIEDAQTPSHGHAGPAGAALLWIHVHLRDPTSVAHLSHGFAPSPPPDAAACRAHSTMPRRRGNGPEHARALPRPGNLLSTLDRRCMAAVVLNKDMAPIARLPSLGELPAAVLEALPTPCTPLDVADIPHHVGLPGARMERALLSMAAADRGMSMLMTVSLQHVKDAMQQQQMHAPQPWEENARQWLHVEGVPPTHTAGMADVGKLVVFEGAEYWACVWMEAGGLEWAVVTACRLSRQQSRGPACHRLFRECLRSLGPVRRAHRCTTGDIPQAQAVFVEVTQPLKVQGQDVACSP